MCVYKIVKKISKNHFKMQIMNSVLDGWMGIAGSSLAWEVLREHGSVALKRDKP